MCHWTPGTHTSTFMGNAVNLAAGRAAIGVLRDERLAERSATLGARVSSRLQDALADDPQRRRGPRPRPLHRHRDRRPTASPATADAARAAAIRRAAFERGVLLGGGGHHSRTSSRSARR